MMDSCRRTRSQAVSTASPTHSKFLLRIGTDPMKFASSTPAASVRPLPEFLESNNKLFQFRNHQPFHSKTLIPRSPVKSAPPISRVFPHRQWAHEKAHAVSFRDGDGESNLVDSAIQSRFYDSGRSELYFEQCFTIEKKLGEGSFGEVMKVKSLDNGKSYAVKRSREKFRNEADRMRKLDEVKKHEQLPKHPNCVEFVKAWEENHRLYIQTELCSMSVQEYWENKGSISEEKVWSILIDLLNGLGHIHKHGFIHLDIKPANIFISKSDQCKIGDFGLVVDNTDIADAREGDNKYMAPELLNSVFSTKADVFSLGIAILELASNIELPRHGAPWRLLRLGYIPPECTQCISPDLCCIIQWMLTPDYEERPNIAEILAHPIISNRRRRAFPMIVYKACTSFIYHLLSLFVHFLFRILIHPFSILLRPMSKSNNVTKYQHVNDSPNFKWESTDSNAELHSSSSSEGSHVPSSSRCQNGVFFTPNIKSRSRSRFTPTPRNSSPVASRVRHTASAGNVSLDLSPLSHSKNHYNLLNSTGKNRSNLDKLDCFLSDISDNEDSTYYSDSLLASKPRNLLDMLNNLSDSDASSVQEL
uniref:membrane-associated tyrosine- and threonine-specific cdc2-inhibitory kinase-like n=1 Tax=Styela clava TaxID=7725 RepID=UPI00193A03F4|nr:membrane-associated tyrosine- and threonine-specific cdc2-inhibitory kinase-like [Styela clava]